MLNLVFDDLNAVEAVRLVGARGSHAPFGYVVTPNADHIVRLSRSPSLLRIYSDAWLCLLDSRVVAAAARLLQICRPSVAPGSDLTQILLAEHLRPGERITIVGLAPKLLPALVQRYRLAPPAHCYPPIGFDTDPALLRDVVDFVLANPARLIFLAVGSPRQERLCEAIAATGLATGTALCIGVSLEYLAGGASRAPFFMQRMGLEWLHRLVRNPRRLARRYLVNCPPVFLLLLREARKAKP